MVDRIGGRWIIFAGGFFLLIALTLLSRLSALWQLYLFFGLIVALGASITHFVPGQVISRKWFTKKAGLASGIIAAALGIGSAVLAPILTGMAGSIGWRTTWFICALGFGIIIMLLAWLVIRDTPESMGLHPDGAAEAPREADVTSLVAGEAMGSAREALRTPLFWLIFVAYSLPFIPIQGMMTQLVMWGVDLGEPLATAGIFITAFALPSVPIKILGGWLGDRYGKRRLMILANCVSLLVMVGAWLTVSSRSSLFIIAILFGMSYGLPFALFIPYLGDLYGRASLGTLVGILTFGSGFVGGSGPLIWGSIADITGSYNPACLVSAIAYAIAIVALILMKPEKMALRR
ncbi:L-lactate transporter [subsurface metagenome]